MRVAPRDDAPAVKNGSGADVILPYDAIFARLSNRNPYCSDAPGPRRSVNGFIWGYGVRRGSDRHPEASSKRQGWAKVADMEGYPAYEWNLCGPADEDWDGRGRGRANPDGSKCPSAGCDGRPAPDLTPSTACWRIAPSWYNDEIGAFEGRVYLRWAPNSTTIFWLMAGDVVRRRAYTGALGNPPRKWSCVEVVCSATCPTAQRGWIRSEALGSVVACPKPCPMPYPFTQTLS